MARKAKPKEDPLKEAELRHHLFQRGMFLSGEQRIDGATLLFSGDIKDFYWNYAAQINTSEAGFDSVVKEVVDFYRKMERSPCICITPLSRPQNIKELLSNAGFVKRATESWMFFEKKKVKIALPGNFVILKAGSINQIMEFIDVFNQSFSVDGDPYCKLPKEYGESLFRSFTEQSAPAAIVHYIGYADEIPVSICTTISDGRYAGIYNAGTVEHKRKSGFGTAVTLTAISDLLKSKVKTIFLRAPTGSENEAFFAELGFSTKFIPDFFVLEDKSYSEPNMALHTEKFSSEHSA